MTVDTREYSANNNQQNNNLVLLKEQEIPAEFRDPFITDGYRRPGCSLWKCFKTLFKIHNETVNVWSHLIAAIAFVAFCMPVFRVNNPLKDSFVCPLLAFAMGITALLVMSSTAHLFNCVSRKGRHICFFLDYASVSTYTFTAAQAFFFYSRPTNTNFYLLQSAPLFLGLAALLSAGSTYLSCASRHAWIKHKFIIRTGTYMLTWLFNTLPFLWRVAVCNSITQCNPAAYRFFARQFICFFVAALSNVTKIPERFIPGWFNYFGQSHHFMHVLCVVGSLDDFLAVQVDMHARRNILTANAAFAAPTFANSILLMLAILCINIGIVVWFAITCPDDDRAKTD